MASGAARRKEEDEDADFMDRTEHERRTQAASLGFDFVKPPLEVWVVGEGK